MGPHTSMNPWLYRHPRLIALVVLYAVVMGVLAPVWVDTGDSRLSWVFWVNFPVGWIFVVAMWAMVATPLIVLFPSLLNPPAAIDWALGFVIWGIAAAMQATVVILATTALRTGAKNCRARRLRVHLP